NVLSGGAVVDTTVSATLNVSSGGVADPTTIFSGGLETILAGGIDSGAQISGGEQDVFGTASSATVFTGLQLVEAGGVVSGTTIELGGQTVVLAGGQAVSALVASGTSGSMNLIVSSGGATVAAQVVNGGREVVFTGGTTTGTVLSGTGLTSNTSTV